jgi:hypothetical protein
MNRGAWHQCGDKSQKIVFEELQHGNGSGVIISPRDLARHKAEEYAKKYQDLGAQVLLDHQFYVPDFANTNLSSYPICQHRAAISQLHQISDAALDVLAKDLEESNRELGVAALVAPAAIYAAGRTDIVQLNARLFLAAKRAGDVLGIPTYATVVLGRSVTSSLQTLSPVLSQVTALDAHGWYFAFEFGADRIPSDQVDVELAGQALLTFACTGLPVLHAYAGPMSLLSLGFGASAAGIGHSQNTWQFTPDRWQPSSGQGGGGDAPPRFFSSGLWGTVIFPDETARLPAAVIPQVMTYSPFSDPVAQKPPQSWSRWDANKHLLYVIGKTIEQIARPNNARLCAHAADQLLDNAVSLHGQIAGSGLALADDTNSYQSNWRDALRTTLTNSSKDYDYLEMLRQ